MPAAERHGRGQYFTPVDLISFVLGLCPDPDGLVLDPACGSGRFLLAARARWGCAVRGFETDRAALAAARAQVEGEIVGEDFLSAPGRGDVSLIVGNPPYVRRLGAKRDLYVDFVERAAAHLRPGGRLALVLSNAWLDTGYGEVIRSLLLRDYAIEWLVEGSGDAWFPGAKVRTVVLVARLAGPGRLGSVGSGLVRFGSVADLGGDVEVLRTVKQEAMDPTGSWGPYLRAPELWFTLREGLVPLDSLAEIRRGYTTNDNRFFYPPADAGIEDSCLRPLLKGPKRVPGAVFSADEVRDRVFLCGPEAPPGAAAWIGDREAWTLRDQEPARLFLLKGYHRTFRQPMCRTPIHYDQQIYGVYPRDGVQLEWLARTLNQPWTQLDLEMAGRVNFGDGVLWLALADARHKLRLPPPGSLDPLGAHAPEIEAAAQAATEHRLRLAR